MDALMIQFRHMLYGVRSSNTTCTACGVRSSNSTCTACIVVHWLYNRYSWFQFYEVLKLHN
jgi:hypothetical protein